MQASGPRPPVSSLSALQHVLLFVVDGVPGPRPLPGHLEPVGKPVDRDDPFGAEQVRARDGELSDRTSTPHRDHVALLDVAHLGAHVAGRKDVREEEHLLVRHAGGHLERTNVGERHARILGLPPGEAAEHVGIAEDTRGRVPHQLLGNPRVGVRVLAEREQVRPAGGALAAGDGERHHDAVPDLELLHSRAGLHHLAHELVAHDVALLHRGNEAVEEMKIGSADCGGRDLDDRVLRIEDFRVGHLLHPDFLLAFPAGRFHRLAPCPCGFTFRGVSEGRAGWGRP